MNDYQQLPPPADPAPGWKTDPLDGNQYRWWSGQAWTEFAGVGQSWNQGDVEAAAARVTQAPAPTATAPMPQSTGPAPLVASQPARTLPASSLRPDIEAAGQRMNVVVGTKREIVRLRDLIGEHERVLEMSKGDLDGRSGLTVLTDQQFIFMSDDASGTYEEHHPVDSLNGISFSSGMLSGELTIRIDGRDLKVKSVPKTDGKRLVAAAGRFVTPEAATMPGPELENEPAAATAFRVLRNGESHWRRSNMMGVLNTDLAKQLDAETLGARLWRIEPGQASTRHRHRQTVELYLLIEGKGKLRVGDELLELDPLDAVLVEPGTLRQPFNDTDADQLWMVTGAPQELANTVDMNETDLAWLYPDGPRALPPELEG